MSVGSLRRLPSAFAAADESNTDTSLHCRVADEPALPRLRVRRYRLRARRHDDLIVDERAPVLLLFC